VPTEPVIVFNDTEPGFVMSLDRMAEPGYVLGGASGWQSPQAGLWLLDGDTLAPRHEQRLDAEMVWARYDPWADQVVAVTEDDNHVSLRWLERDGQGGLVETRQVSVCNPCAPAASSPLLLDGGRAAVAARSLGDDTVLARVWSEDTATLYEPDPVVGDSPQLLPSSEGPVLCFLRGGELWQLPLGWHGGWLGEPSATSPGPYRALLTAELGADPGGGAVAGDWLVLMTEPQPPAEPEVVLMKRDSAATLSELARLPGLLPYDLPLALSESLGTVALAWGVTFGAGEVGPHLTIVDAVSGEPSLAPQLIDHPINHSASSHSIWAAAAPHPAGHALVWGAWREDTHNGIYGKIIRRTAGAPAP
jgi:hypothetical protein